MRTFLRFWYDFLVGEDWRIAAGVVVVLALDAALVAGTGASDTLVALAGAAGIMAVVYAGIFLGREENPPLPRQVVVQRRSHEGNNGLPPLDTKQKHTET